MSPFSLCKRFAFAMPNIWLMALLGFVMLPLSLPALAAAVTAPSKHHSQLMQLNGQSRQLIAKLKRGDAEAVAFRTHVVYYRETLRSLMLANEKARNHKIANPLLMKMVRMAALLQSAAECHTGRYISCPANLMHELDRQQQQLDQVLPVKPAHDE